MKKVTDPAFRLYGRILPVDTKEFCALINAKEPVQAGTVYEPSVAAFEKLPLFTVMQNQVYGELPVEFGHCSGWNEKLNGLEYHRSSEIDIAATDLILMLGHQYDIDYTTYTYDTKNVECFLVPAGTAVELYATTLHFAPCGVGGKEFRCGVVLPKGTNEPLKQPLSRSGENQLLFANNKWLLVHEESGLQNEGAFVGLRGKNISL